MRPRAGIEPCRIPHVFDDGKIAALRIGIVAVDVAAKHEAALVGLADIEMAGAESDDGVDQRLQAFGDEGLQHMAFDRQAQAGHRRQPRGASGHGERDFLRPGRPARRFDAENSFGVDHEAGHFAVLQDIDAAPSAARA